MDIPFTVDLFKGSLPGGIPLVGCERDPFLDLSLQVVDIILLEEVSRNTWFDGFKFRHLIREVAVRDDRTSKGQRVDSRESYISRRHTHMSMIEQLSEGFCLIAWTIHPYLLFYACSFRIFFYMDILYIFAHEDDVDQTILLF